MWGGRGSAHHYSPLWGWAKPYPEATGYLIPTLLNWERLGGDGMLVAMARRWAHWLLEIQQPCGTWPGGYLGGRAPSVFNTAVILDGLTVMLQRVPDDIALRDGAERGLSRLVAMLDADGAWRQGLYVAGFVPAYHAYAVAAAVRAAEHLSRPEMSLSLSRAHAYCASYLSEEGMLSCAGFKPGRWAFTHTLAYALQGLWDAARCFSDTPTQQRVLKACKSLQRLWEQKRRIAGRYSEDWRGDYSFTCPVGNAQLSVLFRTIGRQTADEELETWADWALAEALKHQHRSKNPNIGGALPGSAPFWGPYMRGRYPNWAAKFLLDALYLALSPAEE